LALLLDLDLTDCFHLIDRRQLVATTANPVALSPSGFRLDECYFDRKALDKQFEPN
jgi:hypothetical protein